MSNEMDAREALASLVADFKERLEADEEWGVESYALPESMPRYSAKAVDAAKAAQVRTDTKSFRRPSPPTAPTPPPPEQATAAERKVAPPQPVKRNAPANLFPKEDMPLPRQPKGDPSQRPPAYTPPPPPEMGTGAEPGSDGTPQLLDVPEGGLEGLDFVRTTLGECMRCPLAPGRNTLVFGEGNPEARLMFIGEGPGFHEDKQGRPFVGPAGQLLDKMIAAMGYQRSEVYIANVVKCRPPDNRDPTQEERYACRPFLVGQIQAIQPEVIVTLGKVASQTVLETDARISRLRGRWTEYPRLGIPVMPTYHPAALLRNAHLKRPVWEDLQKVMETLQA